MPNTSPIFFPSFDDFHAWLEGNHDKLAEAWIGYHKRGTGRPSLTWPQSVSSSAWCTATSTPTS